MTIIINADHIGQRVDNFLLGQFKLVPKSRIYKAIRKGEVRVNKKRVKPEERLKEGDEVRLPPLWQEERQQRIPSQSLQALLKKSVIYENQDIVIINKPRGLVVHGGTHIDIGLIEALRYVRSDLTYLELVHRLDKETSGCLLLAKSLRIRRELHHLFVERKIKKTYLALVKGQWKGGEKKVDVSIDKKSTPSGEGRMRVDVGGKSALTLFRPYKIYDEMSMVEAEIKTGRMHQIRVHAAYIGYPIVGDDKYGDRKFNTEVSKKIGKNLFLHSAALEFQIPSNGRIIAVCATLDRIWKIKGFNSNQEYFS